MLLLPVMRIAEPPQLPANEQPIVWPLKSKSAPLASVTAYARQLRSTARSQFEVQVVSQLVTETACAGSPVARTRPSACAAGTIPFVHRSRIRIVVAPFRGMAGAVAPGFSTVASRRRGHRARRAPRAPEGSNARARERAVRRYECVRISSVVGARRRQRV